AALREARNATTVSLRRALDDPHRAAGAVGARARHRPAARAVPAGVVEDAACALHRPAHLLRRPAGDALRGGAVHAIACGLGILLGAVVCGVAVLRNLLLPVF